MATVAEVAKIYDKNNGGFSRSVRYARGRTEIRVVVYVPSAAHDELVVLGVEFDPGKNGVALAIVAEGVDAAVALDPILRIAVCTPLIDARAACEVLADRLVEIGELAGPSLGFRALSLSWFTSAQTSRDAARERMIDAASRWARDAYVPSIHDVKLSFRSSPAEAFRGFTEHVTQADREIGRAVLG